MDNRKFLLFVGGVFLFLCGFAWADDWTIPNLNNDDRTNFIDFALLAQNWQAEGSGLAGDLDGSGTVDIDDLMIFNWYWLAEYSPYQQCQQVDLDNDGIIAFEDVALVAQNWLKEDQGLAGDFDDSNSVDYNDLRAVVDCWLQGVRPLGIWESFKAALAIGEIDTALTFIAQAARDKYAQIFQIIEPNLPEYTAGMGDLIFESQDEGTAKYEMIHQAGSETYLFPVIFIKNDKGVWQIYKF